MTHLNGKAPTAAAIQRTLDLLFDPEQVIELRALVSKKQIDAGYFTDREKLISTALAYDGKAPQYVVANTIDPRLLARYNNRMERYAPATTTDDQVIARRWLPIEFDPDRPSGIPASDAEHAEAHRRAVDCQAWLVAYGWPAPIYADSGNGAWLLYRLPDLANTAELTAKIKRCLAIVSLLYQGRQTEGGIAVKVDETVFNAARLVRLFGTANLKGDGDAAHGRHNRASNICCVLVSRARCPFPESRQGVPGNPGGTTVSFSSTNSSIGWRSYVPSRPDHLIPRAAGYYRTSWGRPI